MSGLTELARKLIGIKSITGQEKKLAQFIYQVMDELGYDEAFIDEAGNVVGCIRGSSRKRILFDAHIDTVGVGDYSKWAVDPFGGEIVEGRLYGRGAADMKGALAAMLWAGAELAKNSERDHADIYISGTVSEEIAEGRCFELVLDRVKPDYVVIGEASELNLKIGQRGRAEIVMECIGKSAHSSTPELAVNAVEHLVDAITCLRQIELPEDPMLGKGILALTDIISEPFPGQSVIPYRARCTYDRRLLVGEGEPQVLEGIRNYLRPLYKENPLIKINLCIAEEEVVTYTGYRFMNKKLFPAWLMPEDHSFCQSALTALKTAGLNPGITVYSFCTNGSSSAGKRQIPTIGFGPGSEDQAHTVDEHVALKDLQLACDGYQALMRCVE